MTNQQLASQLLDRWQELRDAGLTPEERLDRLIAEFFSPRPPCDVEYSATERTLIEVWANA